MKNLIYITLLFLFTTVSAYAQPGIATQNSLSFETAGQNVFAKIANRSLITIYPTGGTTFNVPNVGSISGNVYESNDVRVVVLSNNSPIYYLGQLTFLSPGQINLWAIAANFNTFTSPNILFGNVTFVVQKRVSNVWTNISQPGVAYFEYATPHQSTVFSGGTGFANADLYIYNGNTYIFYKKLFGNASQPLSGLSPTDNPRSANGQPSVLAFYVTGAQAPQPLFEICATDMKLSGTSRSDLLLSSYVASGFNGVQQVNVLVPSTLTGSNTIQFGIRPKTVSDGCNLSMVYGNITTVGGNWVN